MFSSIKTVCASQEWLIGYQGYDILEGEPHKPGSKFLLKFETEGKKIQFTETLTAFKENEEFSCDMETEYFTGSVQVLVEGSNPCTLTAHSTIEGLTLFNRSLFYLMKSAMKDQSQKNYDLLKDMIEE